ncbi:MAG: hypothetical protein WDL87_03340 [Candidatus Omnitrophota bacterium]|jgi:hypothetical protein
MNSKKILLTSFFLIFCVSSACYCQDYLAQGLSEDEKRSMYVVAGIFLYVFVYVMSIYLSPHIERRWKNTFNLVSLLLIAVIPLTCYRIEMVKLESEVNNTRYSQHPLRVVRQYPLAPGMTKAEVEQRWGTPRSIGNWGPAGTEFMTNTGPVEDHWYYSRMYSTSSGIGNFLVLEAAYKVELVFYDGKLGYAMPSIENINQGKLISNARQ